MIHKALIAVCALSVVTGVARANLITNPSFEMPVVTPGSFENFLSGSSAIPGWTVTGPDDTDVSIVSTTFSQGGVSFQAFDGTQWLDLTGDGSNSTEGVEQTVPTIAGMNYVLTFYIGNTTGGGIFGTTSTDALKINGTQVGTFTNSNTANSSLSWEKFTYTFAGTGSSTTIEFDNRDPGNDNSNGLDLVNLEVGRSANAPEPAVSLALIGSAGLLFSLWMRRNDKRKNS